MTTALVGTLGEVGAAGVSNLSEEDLQNLTAAAQQTLGTGGTSFEAVAVVPGLVNIQIAIENDLL